MKKVSFGVLAMLLTFGWLLLMVACSGGGSSGDSDDGGGGGGGGTGTVDVTDIPDVNELMNVISGQSSEDLAPLTQTNLDNTMSALDNLGALALTTADWCTAGDMNSVCTGGGTYTWGPSGNGCEFDIVNCNMGQGMVMNGTIIESLISSSNPIAVSIDMDMTMTVPQSPTPVSYSYDMDVIIHSLNPTSCTVVVHDMTVANQYLVYGANNCAVTITWNSATSCYTVDSVAPAGCTSATSTCP